MARGEKYARKGRRCESGYHKYVDSKGKVWCKKAKKKARSRSRSRSPSRYQSVNYLERARDPRQTVRPRRLKNGKYRCPAGYRAAKGASGKGRTCIRGSAGEYSGSTVAPMIGPMWRPGELPPSAPTGGAYVPPFASSVPAAPAVGVPTAPAVGGVPAAPPVGGVPAAAGEYLNGVSQQMAALAIANSNYRVLGGALRGWGDGGAMKPGAQVPSAPAMPS